MRTGGPNGGIISRFHGRSQRQLWQHWGPRSRGQRGLVLSARQTQSWLLSGLVLRHDSVMALAWAPPKSRSPSISGIR